MTTLVLHPALAPYRVDFFNWLIDRYNPHLYFYYRNVKNQKFNSADTSERLHISPKYLPEHSSLVVRFYNLFILLRKIKPDRIFLSEFGYFTLYIFLLRLFGFIKKAELITLCDDNVESFKSLKLHSKWLRRILSKYFRLIIVVSDEMSEYWSKFISKRAITVAVPIIRDENQFTKQLKEAKQHPHFNYYRAKYSDVKSLLFVGRLESVKNLFRLLDAWRFVLQEERNCKLIIVGEGSQLSNLIKYSVKLGLENSVEFLGRKDGLEIISISQSCSYAILPSTYERFGAVINEFLLNGCFSLVSRNCGGRILIHEGVNGYLFDPHDVSNIYSKIKLAFDEEIAVPENLMQIRFKDIMESLEIELKRVISW